MKKDQHHPLQGIDNSTITKLRNGEATTGIFCVSGSPLITECCAMHGFDWLVLDMEASPMSRATLTQCLQAVSGSSATSLVRVATHCKHAIEAALDSGSLGVIIPRVDNSKQARQVVDSVYYPPIGSRGLNPIRCSGYFTNLAAYVELANTQMLCMVQIETQDALNNLDDILAVDGIHGAFVGCGDLSMDLGCFGEMRNPLMTEAISLVLEACQNVKKIPGIFAYSNELAVEYKRSGYQFVAVGNDIKFLNAGIGLTKEAINI